jgi:hypothetical protein
MKVAAAIVTERGGRLQDDGAVEGDTREIEVARVRINDEGWRVLAEKPLGKE